VGTYRQARFGDARSYASAVLRDNPSDTKANDLLNAIDEQVQRDGLFGMAIVGAAVAAVGLFVGLVTRK
jgi:fission 1 protein